MAKGNFIESLRTAQNATNAVQGEQPSTTEQNTNRVVPKAPSFKYADPIDSYLKKSDIEDDVQEMLWELYEGDKSAIQDGKAPNLGSDILDFRRRLKTDKDFFDWYTNSLLERNRRGESPYGTDSTNINITDLLKNLRQHSSGVEATRRTR